MSITEKLTLKNVNIRLEQQGCEVRIVFTMRDEYDALLQYDKLNYEFAKGNIGFVLEGTKWTDS